MSDYSIRAILSAVDNGFTNTLDQAQGSVSKFENTATKVGNGMAKVGGVMTAGITAPVMAAGTAAVSAATDFETAFAKVQTIADPTEVSLDELRGTILDLSTDTGVAASDIAESVYGAISAGQSTGEAINFVTNANKLAKAGFTDTASAVDILSTIMNSYGEAAGDVTSISDKLITTQNKGKTTVAELSSAMGKAIPTAKSVGVNIDTLCGAYAVMTSNGIATAESTTYLNSMMNELGKQGSTAADAFAKGTEHIKEGGLTMQEAMEMGWDLTDVLEVLASEAGESGTSINNMFGSAEAGKAAAVLYDNGAQLNSVIEEMAGSAGATETAFDTMQNTASAGMEKMKESATNALIALGSTLLPIVVPAVTKLSEKIQELTEWFSNLDPATQKTILTVAGIAAAAGPVIGIVGKLTSTFGGLIGKLGSLGSAGPVAAQGAGQAAGGLSSLSQGAAGILAVGAAILMVSAGFYVLSQAAISLAEAGPVAIAVMAGLLVAMVGLGFGVVALVTALAPMSGQLVAIGAGLALIGVSVLLVAAGFYLMASASTMLAASGGAAIAVFFGMIAALAALMVLVTALGPGLVVGGAGAALLGAGLMMMGVAALLCAAALAIITGLLPQLSTYGASGATAITALGVSLMAFGAGATVGGAGAAVLAAGLLAMGAGAVVATAGMLPLAVALAAVTAEIAVISAGARSAASDIESMASGVSVVESGLNAIKSIASSAGQALTKLFTSSQQSADQAGQAIGTQLNNNIKNGMTKMVQTSTQSMAKFVLGLQTGGLKAVSLARSISNSTASAFNSGQGAAYNSGRYVGQGFANGILSMTGSVASAAASLAGAANRSIVVTARIGSPSKVARQYGEWYGEGYGLGIEDMFNFVSNAGRGLVRAGQAVANGYRAATDDKYSYGYGGNVTIEVPVNVDGKTLAKAEATYIRNELQALNTRSNRAVGVLG